MPSPLRLLRSWNGRYETDVDADGEYFEVSASEQGRNISIVRYRRTWNKGGIADPILALQVFGFDGRRIVRAPAGATIRDVLVAEELLAQWQVLIGQARVKNWIRERNDVRDRLPPLPKARRASRAKPKHNPTPTSVLERVVHAPTRRDPFVILAWVDDAENRRTGVFAGWGLNTYAPTTRGDTPFDFWVAQVEYGGYGAHAGYRNVDSSKHASVRGVARADGTIELRGGSVALRTLGVHGYARLEQMLARARELEAAR